MKIAINTLIISTLLLGLPTTTDATGIKLDRNGEITRPKEDQKEQQQPAAAEGENANGDDSGADDTRFPGMSLNTNNGLRPTIDLEDPSTTNSAATAEEESSSSNTEEAPTTDESNVDTTAETLATTDTVALSSSNSTESLEEDEQGESTEEEAGIPPCDDCKEIPFYCDLRVDFFEGEGKEPTDDEALAFVDKTEEWMNTVLSTQSPTLFHSVDIGDDLKALYDEAEKDSFSLEFSTVAFVLNQEDTMTIEDLYHFVESANYEEYITDYLWETPPFMLNVFYHTQAVKMSCYGGLRPRDARAAKAADDADATTQDNNQGERRLRGSAATATTIATATPISFGGHAVAVRPTNA